VTKGEGHEVTLRVEAGPEDLAEIIEQTYKDLGSKVKVPGFRTGKIPKQVIDSHLGADYVRSEAVKNGLPTLYVMGVMDAGIVPVSDPEINIIEAGEDEDVHIVFEAKVDVKPEVEVKDYKGIELDAPTPRSPTRTSRRRWTRPATASRLSRSLRCAPPRRATTSCSTTRSSARASRWRASRAPTG